MLTGSIVSSLQGEPRSTHDIDILIEIEHTSVSELVNAFPPPDFYLDEDAFLDAINRQGMVNLIDLTSGDKIDFWMLTDDPFDRSRFSRKRSEDYLGTTLHISSPEDTILAKLRWAKLCGGSEKQFTDAQRVFEVQHGNLDLAYIEHWSKELDVELLWERLRNEADTNTFSAD
jgi:hypothetical protein